MAVKFNPFTGQLQIDEKGSGGGSSYIDGEVQNFSALPQTVGSPAVDSAYLVREAEGAWLLNRKPAGIYIRTANTGTRASDWTYAGEFPDVFNDANLVVYNNTDSTKNVKFDASAIATGTTRTLTVPNASGTIQLTGHAASHASAGSDPIEADSLASNNTGSANALLIADGAGGTSWDTAANVFTQEVSPADIGAAAASHTHDASDITSGSFGNISFDGKLGSTAGLPVVTTTAGAVTTLALGTAGHVLTVNSGATGVEFAAASGGGVTGAAASASDVLGVSGANITGVDANADRIVFWDDSASALKYLEAGSGLTISGTVMTASGGASINQAIAVGFVLN